MTSNLLSIPCPAPPPYDAFTVARIRHSIGKVGMVVYSMLTSYRVILRGVSPTHRQAYVETELGTLASVPIEWLWFPWMEED